MNELGSSLLTIVVFAYSQERTVEEAVESAFAQTYSPLEIILSDDCSPDRTFQIMERLAANYNGPHTVILNRNSKNLGVVDHINYVFSIAKGELIVIAEGDDFSRADRVEKLYQTYLASDRPFLVWSDVTDADLDGTPKRRQRTDRAERNAAFNGLDLSSVATEKNPCVGAACAYRSEVMTVFGNLTERRAFPDKAFYFRARVLGNVAFCGERLVKYRRGGGISTAKPDESSKFEEAKLQTRLAGLVQRRKDCDAIELNDRGVVKVLDKEISRVRRKIDELGS